MARKNTSQKREAQFDPEELQMMDECNEPWVRAWKQASSNTIEIVVAPPKELEKSA